MFPLKSLKSRMTIQASLDRSSDVFCIVGRYHSLFIHQGVDQFVEIGPGKGFDRIGQKSGSESKNMECVGCRSLKQVVKLYGKGVKHRMLKG